MPRARSNTRERLVESASQLLRRQGYHGTGMTQIVAESGAPRGSMYYLFPGGKEELTAEAVAASAVEFTERITQAGAASDNVAEFVVALTGQLAQELRESGFTEGCPISTVTLDAVPQSQALARACRQGYADWLSALEQVLARFGVPADRAAALAMLGLSAVEGALMLCRTTAGTAPLETVREELVAILGNAVSRDQPPQ